MMMLRIDSSDKQMTKSELMDSRVAEICDARSMNLFSHSLLYSWHVQCRPSQLLHHAGCELFALWPTTPRRRLIPEQPKNRSLPEHKWQTHCASASLKEERTHILPMWREKTISKTLIKQTRKVVCRVVHSEMTCEPIRDFSAFFSFHNFIFSFIHSFRVRSMFVCRNCV